MGEDGGVGVGWCGVVCGECCWRQMAPACLTQAEAYGGERWESLQMLKAGVEGSEFAHAMSSTRHFNSTSRGTNREPYTPQHPHLPPPHFPPSAPGVRLKAGGLKAHWQRIFAPQMDPSLWPSHKNPEREIEKEEGGIEIEMI